MSQLIPSTTPLRVFEDHERAVMAVAVFPDKRRMVTGSADKTLRLWDLETSVVLKKMEGHSRGVRALAVSRDDQMIASGDDGGKVIAWHGETGEPLTQPIKAHIYSITSVDFSPDGTVLATSNDVVNFWCTKTWQMQEPITCSTNPVFCIRYSPSGEVLAIATRKYIQIYNAGTRECITTFKGHTEANWALTWTADGTCVVSGGHAIRQWASECLWDISVSSSLSSGHNSGWASIDLYQPSPEIKKVSPVQFDEVLLHLTYINNYAELLIRTNPQLTKYIHGPTPCESA